MNRASILNLPERGEAKASSAICDGSKFFRERAGRLGVNTRMIPLKTDRPAPFIVIRASWRGSGAARTAAILTAPITSHGTRGLVPAGFLNLLRPLKAAGRLFAALVQSCQKASGCFTQTLHVSFVAPALHEQKQTTGGSHEIGSIIQERGFFSQGGTHV